jgi:hypothetical protein
LLVAANVSGAKISVDGRSEPIWVTPYTISDLSVGSHQVVVSKEGYDDYQQSVTIEGGRTNSVTASLAERPAEVPSPPPAEKPPSAKGKPPTKPSEVPGAVPLPSSGGGRPGTSKTGQLQVRANVSGARISVDGRSEANWVAPYTIDLNAGTHQVVVSKDGYDDYQQSVTIEGGKAYQVSAPLSEASGEVAFETTPPGLEVLIDGKSIGVGPARATLRAGTHTYSVTRAGWQPAVGTVQVESGRMKIVRVNMSGGETAEIVSVNTIPAGATVTADGRQIDGQTPTSFRLTPGRHTLVISLSGFRSVQQVIEVKAGQSKEVDVPMTRQ